MNELEKIKLKWITDFPKSLYSEDIDWLIEQVEKVKHYEETLQKIVDMESPFYFRETQSETPYNYARVALERNKS